MKLVALTAGAAALLLTANASAAVIYQVIDLGTIGDYPGNSSGEGINASGQVAGRSQAGPVGNARAFRTNADGTVMTDLGILNGATHSYGWDLNDAGQVAGYAQFANGSSRAFRTNAAGTVMTDLGTIGNAAGSSSAYGINASGQVTGYSQTPGGGVFHAFRTNAAGTVMTDLGTIGGAAGSSFGYDINDVGQVTGYSITASGRTHAFRTNAAGTVMSDLGTIGNFAGNSYGQAINATGQVAGYSEVAGGYIRAFLTNAAGTAMTDLGTIGNIAGSSYAYGLNDAGMVVGAGIAESALNFTAFLYDGTTMLDLNTMIDPSAGWTLTGANAINNAGQITGYGLYGGAYHAFRLTLLEAEAPVPEPATWAMMIAGFGLVGGTLRSRRRSPVFA